MRAALYKQIGFIENVVIEGFKFDERHPLTVPLVLQRIVQAQADDVRGVGVAGHGHADVAAGGLDALGDERGRIEQGAVPVEQHRFQLRLHRLILVPA